MSSCSCFCYLFMFSSESQRTTWISDEFYVLKPSSEFQLCKWKMALFWRVSVGPLLSHMVGDKIWWFDFHLCWIDFEVIVGWSDGSSTNSGWYRLLPKDCLGLSWSHSWNSSFNTWISDKSVCLKQSRAFLVLQSEVGASREVRTVFWFLKLSFWLDKNEIVPCVPWQLWFQ